VQLQRLDAERPHESAQSQPSKSPAAVIGGVVCGIVGGVMCGPPGALIGMSIAGLGILASKATHASGGSQRTFQASEQPRVTAAVAVSVGLPREAMQWRGGTLHFGIDVLPAGGGASWRVMKRYNDFYSLNSHLQQAGPSRSDLTSVATHLVGAPFPRKHLTGCAGQKLEARRQKLELWLQKIVRESQSEWTRPLQHFLDYLQHQPAGSAPLQAATSMPANVALRRQTLSNCK